MPKEDGHWECAKCKQRKKLWPIQAVSYFGNCPNQTMEKQCICVFGICKWKSNVIKMLLVPFILRAIARENRADLTDRGQPIPSIFPLFNTFHQWCWQAIFLDFRSFSFSRSDHPPKNSPLAWKNGVNLDTSNRKRVTIVITSRELPSLRFYYLDL